MSNKNSSAPKIQITEDLKNVPENGLVLFLFPNSEVQTNDVSRFLRDFKPCPSTNKDDIRKLFGSVIFFFAYDEKASEIYEIPAVRKYMQVINEDWPCWLFYAVPDPELFTPLLWCCLQQLQVCRREGADGVEIQYNINELTQLILGWIPKAMELADYAGIPRKRIYERIHHWLVMLLPPAIARDFADNNGHLF